MTTKDKQDAARDIALITFQSGAQRLPSEEEISTYAQMMATISIKLIHGLEGRKFKKDFLKAAIADNEKMTAHKVQ